MIRAGIGMVVLRMDADEGGSLSFAFADSFNSFRSKSITGTVVDVGQVIFLGAEIDAMRKGIHPPDKLIKAISEECGLVDNVPCEIRKGDKVMIHYRYNLDDASDHEKETTDGYRIVRYSDLMCKIMPNGDVYPLNGQVLVVPNPDNPEYERSTKRGDGIRWRVVSEGCDVKQYGIQPSYDEAYDVLIGKTVICERFAPIPVEDGFFSKYDGVCVINRRHIITIE